MSHSCVWVVVTGVDPLLAALPVVGAADRVRLGGHRRLRERAPIVRNTSGDAPSIWVDSGTLVEVFTLWLSMMDAAGVVVRPWWCGRGGRGQGRVRSGTIGRRTGRTDRLLARNKHPVRCRLGGLDGGMESSKRSGPCRCRALDDAARQRAGEEVTTRCLVDLLRLSRIVDPSLRYGLARRRPHHLPAHAPDLPH